MNTEDLGLEEYYHPITKVRLSFYRGKWYVEYRRQPKFFFDRWWWFDDSVHTDFNDAQLRANILAADGSIREFKKKTIEIIVGDRSLPAIVIEQPVEEKEEEKSPNPFSNYMNQKSE